jgi:hypothetical protein
VDVEFFQAHFKGGGRCPIAALLGEGQQGSGVEPDTNQVGGDRTLQLGGTELEDFKTPWASW